MCSGFHICRIQQELQKRRKCNCLKVIYNFGFLSCGDMVEWQNKFESFFCRRDQKRTQIISKHNNEALGSNSTGEIPFSASRVFERILIFSIIMSNLCVFQSAIYV